MPRIPWTQRQFNFNFPVELFPEMLERIRGTPARLEEKLQSLPTPLLTRRDGERWSMQENAGHLLDLEALLSDRLDEYERGATVLQAADMSNRKTFESNHNERSINSILGDFRKERDGILARLDSFPDEMFARSALHPRLNVQMRLVDMILFQAEHDDFHLTRITELMRLFDRSS